MWVSWGWFTVPIPIIGLQSLAFLLVFALAGPWFLFFYTVFNTLHKLKGRLIKTICNNYSHMFLLQFCMLLRWFIKIEGKSRQALDCSQRHTKINSDKRNQKFDFPEYVCPRKVLRGTPPEDRQNNNGRVPPHFACKNLNSLSTVTFPKIAVLFRVF